MAKRNAGIEERIGKAISAQRMARELSQAQLAEEMGVDKDTISRFERGAVLPPLARLIQLADIFEIPLEDLIRGASSNVADAAPDIARMLAKLDDDGRQFVRHIVEELCERLAPKGARS
jgi:transcriptional regulator with XRE-family HTH domain